MTEHQTEIFNELIEYLTKNDYIDSSSNVTEESTFDSLGIDSLDTASIQFDLEALYHCENIDITKYNTIKEVILKLEEITNGNNHSES